MPTPTPIPITELHNLVTLNFLNSDVHVDGNFAKAHAISQATGVNTFSFTDTTSIVQPVAGTHLTLSASESTSIAATQGAHIDWSWA